MDDQQRAADCLQQCMRSASVTLASAETHRTSCESCIRNALHYGEFDGETRKRLQRLLTSLTAAASAIPQRKVDLLTQTVIPTLESLSLVDVMD